MPFTPRLQKTSIDWSIPWSWAIRIGALLAMWSELPWGSARMRPPITASSPCSDDGAGIEFAAWSMRRAYIRSADGSVRAATMRSRKYSGRHWMTSVRVRKGSAIAPSRINTPVFVTRPVQESLELVLEHDVAAERDHDVGLELGVSRRGDAQECQRVVDALVKVQVGEVVGNDGRVERLGEGGECGNGALARARSLPPDEEDALASEAFRERAPVGFVELETMPGDHADVREVRHSELHAAVALDRHVEVDRTAATLPGRDECFVDHPVAVPAVARRS